jgi:hypothetical protein
MLGHHAALSIPRTVDDRVLTTLELSNRGWTRGQIRAQLDARRWQRHGRAIVAHNGPLSRGEQMRVALINCGPRSILTSLTAAELLGLKGWLRPEIHVLVPAGARVSPALSPAVRVHYVARWDEVRALGRRRIQELPQALMVAVADLVNPRSAVGLLAAAVQQGMLRAVHLRRVLDEQSNLRNQRLLKTCVDDIAQGSQALSEIDFVALCRRARLPPPRRQAVRTFRGRRRYLDAEWDLPDGRTLVAEVDGALHLVAQRWWDDQLRQNDLTLSGSLVLRFPSIVLRTEPELVVRQLRRALRC